MSFELFWVKYDGCPRCKQTEANRLAASNAWYHQQQKIDDAVEALEQAHHAMTEGDQYNKSQAVVDINKALKRLKNE